MENAPKYFIVDAAVMPEVFRRVAQAKALLQAGDAPTVNAAVQAAGISRSAYYKYKDAVHPLQDMLHGRIVTLQILLRDEPGVLSGVLSLLAGSGGNVLTINQSIPVNGCAGVTISAETNSLEMSLEELVQAVRTQTGVLRCDILAG